MAADVSDCSSELESAKKKKILSRPTQFVFGQ